MTHCGTKEGRQQHFARSCSIFVPRGREESKFRLPPSSFLRCLLRHFCHEEYSLPLSLSLSLSLSVSLSPSLSLSLPPLSLSLSLSLSSRHLTWSANASRGRIHTQLLLPSVLRLLSSLDPSRGYLSVSLTRWRRGETQQKCGCFK